MTRSLQTQIASGDKYNLFLTHWNHKGYPKYYFHPILIPKKGNKLAKHWEVGV